jgi:hypothetical protein
MISEVIPFLDDKYKDQQKEIMWNLARMLDSSPLLVERFESAMKELEPESTGVRLMIAALGHLCSAKAQEILGSRAAGNSTTASDARIALAMCPEPLSQNTFKRLNQLYISTPPSDLKKEYGYVIGSALRTGNDLDSILTLKKAWLDVERQVPAIQTSDLKEGISEVLDASLESSEGGSVRTDPSTKETRASGAEVRADSSISGIPVDESYVEQRVGILEAFGNSGRDEFLPEIVAALMSDVPALQASALDSLRFHRSNKARDLLFEFLNEPNLPETVKAVGYETLKWQLSDSRSVPALQNCRDTGSDTLKKTCNEILESIDSGDLSEDKEDES